MAVKFKTMDGNEAAAWSSYAFTEVAGIYPITPSSPMAEYTDEWASRGHKNIFGMPVKVVEMQSEAGAAGTVHGSLQAGALTTTYTASQGLLLKIPNMYKMAGELLPGVIHVSARALSAQALSIFGDHQDIYAARMTGYAMLASNSVQEVMDLAGLAHIVALKSRIPFLHFFDGFRTSHEIQKVEVMDYDILKRLVDMNDIQEFRNRALNPEHPVTRGTAQNDDIYFQTREVQNKFYDAVPDIVADYMTRISAEIEKASGRKVDYKPFNYYGAPNADRIIIAMGSVIEAAKETIDMMNAAGENVGILSVHLYRPFSAKYFFDVLPKSVEKIAVLDRTKEPGALGEPLYLDVKSLFYTAEKQPLIVGGRYGLSSKDVTPDQIVAVFNNLKAETPKDQFTVGINDDVTFTSLELPTDVEVVIPGQTECLFFGLGSDGTVGANKNSIKIIGDKTDLYAQGYFAYDSKKSGGVTRSHLRFGKAPIQSTYLVTRPNFVACSMPSYLDKYDMTSGLRKNGTFLLNCVWDKDEVVANLPNAIKRNLAKKNAKFYIINATKLAVEIGLGNRTNTIMQSAFFKLSNVIDFADAQKYMKEYAEKTYGKKGENIVKMNFNAIDRGAGELVEITVDPAWANLKDEENCEFGACECTSSCNKTESFVKKIAAPINAIKGDNLPVSAFLGYEDGTFENGTTAYEKREIAVNVPKWVDANCIQCNQCAFVCPHAVIRPFLLNEEEKAAAPNELVTKKAIGKGLEGLEFRIQVSPLDCTGCGVCANVCPAKEKALVMVPIAEEKEAGEVANAEYLFNNVEYKDTLMDKTATVKGSQFAQPLFEFHGACAGCGETPYIKAITQLFGDRMMVANATGCSSIYGGSAPSTPYTTNKCGHGPSWGSSLFEDNAEFGYGMHMAVESMKARIQNIFETSTCLPEDVKTLGNEWIANQDNGAVTKEITAKLVPMLEKLECPDAKDLLDLKQYFITKSQWIFGGDGWAYDIGYGGLDHVLASRDNVNVLVMDTEVYSNTGGQASKSTQTGAVAKFAAAGKPNKKKDLAAIAMSYGHIYVAQVSMGANQGQYLKAIKEAEAYNGPSLIIAYSPCVNHGLKKGMGQSQLEMKLATECGYWPIFRYNPALEAEGKNPLQIDSKAPNWDKYEEYLMGEVRYATLTKSNPAHATELFAANKAEAQRRWRQYERLSAMDFATEKKD